ncbi:hypothetical protein, partial [Streptomyces sp. SID1034]|uniref:hypothetical protein n=1 Tax=Streptomyces sp. SID1034 TaxID=2690248 RepID=UPI001F467931
MTALWETQHKTLGGSRDTELKALAVIPWMCSPPTLRTMTPVAKRDIVSRNVAGVMEIESAA